MITVNIVVYWLAIDPALREHGNGYNNDLHLGRAYNLDIDPTWPLCILMTLVSI